jgi:hypothetical protein
MKKFIVMAVLVLGCGKLYAQTYYAVMVMDSRNGNPITGASIKIKPSGKVIITSESGNAVVFASSEDSLQVQSKGYKDRAISMQNQPLAISILMTPVPKVVASKPKKKKH